MNSATQVSLIQGLDTSGWHVASLNSQIEMRPVCPLLP
jgi:hypothetical protein